MALRWDERVRAAERLQFDSTVLGRILKAVGLSSLYRRNVPNTKWRLVRLGWVLVPRNLKLAAGGLIAAWVIVLLAVVAFTVVAAHLLA
jgi:hypothetical protein